MISKVIFISYNYTIVPTKKIFIVPTIFISVGLTSPNLPASATPQVWACWPGDGRWFRAKVAPCLFQVATLKKTKG